MRLSSVMFAVVLLFSPVVFAQHSSTGSAPSSPPPAPAPAPSPSPASSSSSSSSASSFHSAPSSPSPASPPSFSSSSSSSMSSHASSAPASSTSEPAASRPTAQTNEGRPSEPHASEPAPDRINPEAKIGSEEKIVPSSRIGEGPAAKEKEKEKDPKAPESGLRRPICKDGPCKGVVPKPPVETDLRRPVCKDKPCTCPPGEVLGTHGGCVASNPANGSEQCGAGQYWNGAGCAAIARTCQPNEYWNGVACVNSQTECATINASAALAANEVRAARAQMQSACMDDPSGQECSDLKQNYAARLSDTGWRSAGPR